jgi:hypothetical protein
VSRPLTALEQASFVDALREALGLVPISHHYMDRRNLSADGHRSQADDRFLRRAIGAIPDGNYRRSTRTGGLQRL